MISKRKFYGYTLVEVLITVTVVSVVISGLMVEYVSLLKGYEMTDTYRDLHNQARMGMDQFSRDLRAASGISTGTSNSVSFLVPVVGSGNVVTSTNTITYSCQSNQFLREMVSGSTTNSTVIARQVESVQFEYYLRDNSTTATNVTMAFNLYAKITCSAGISGLKKVDFIQTRTLMRNKHS